MIKEGCPYFDVEKMLNERDKYSNFISKFTDFDEQRIKEDKSDRFNRELKKALEKIKKILIDEKYINENGEFTEKSIKLYAKKIIGNYEKEIIGIHEYGKFLSYRLGKDEEFYSKKFSIGDKYSEISVKKSILNSIRKGRIEFYVDKNREAKGGKYIILLDISGSMIKEKIYEAKKALIVVGEKIIEDGNMLSIILYNNKVVKVYDNIRGILDVFKDILLIYPYGSTDISIAIEEASKYIEEKSHILIITDALPTFGEKPVEKTIETVKRISDRAYISVVGIRLNEEGEKIAREIVKYGKGNLFLVKNYEDIGKIVLLDYYLSKIR